MWSLGCTYFKTAGASTPRGDETRLEHHHEQGTLGQAVVARWDRHSCSGFRREFEARGPADGYPVLRVVTDMGESGFAWNRLAIKCDIEYAMVAFLKRLVHTGSGNRRLGGFLRVTPRVMAR